MVVPCPKRVACPSSSAVLWPVPFASSSSAAITPSDASLSWVDSAFA